MPEKEFSYLNKSWKQTDGFALKKKSLRMREHTEGFRKKKSLIIVLQTCCCVQIRQPC